MHAGRVCRSYYSKVVPPPTGGTPAPGEFHDRLWLDPEVHAPKLLEPLLRPYPSEELVVHPVDSLVNNPRHEDPRCVESMP